MLCSTAFILNNALPILLFHLNEILGTRDSPIENLHQRLKQSSGDILVNLSEFIKAY